VAVYLQAYRALRMDWVHQEFQIWRAKPRFKTAQSVNMAIQPDINRIIFPCEGDLDFVRIAASEGVSEGSTDTDVGVETPFDLLDSEGNVRTEGCIFKGEPYAPTADQGDLFAGTITCKDLTPIRCMRPYLNRAETCNGPSPSDCGVLGKNCPTFYQLLATCIM
jgi:hypothetical protein